MLYTVKIKTEDIEKDNLYEDTLIKVLTGFKLKQDGHLSVNLGDSVMNNPKFHKLVNNFMGAGDTILFYDIVSSINTFDELIFLLQMLKANEFNYIDLAHIEATTMIYTQEFLYTEMVHHISIVKEYLTVRKAVESGNEVEVQWVKPILPNFKSLVKAALLKAGALMPITPALLNTYSLETGSVDVRFNGTYEDLTRYIRGRKEAWEVKNDEQEYT